jgi:UDP-N-acetylglucosamine--N-acetylmuramyl-(pentapeptide) pyrophosphoryl-undecaprenol N-acetylglucosamine transferase
MILVPQTIAADNHQLANARGVEQQGAAIVVEQNNLDVLAGRAIEIISNPTIFSIMQPSLEKIFVPDVVEQIAQFIENFRQKRKRKVK